MTQILIQDTARNNLASWAADAVAAGAAAGAVIDPFSSSPVATGSKAPAHRIAEQIRMAGGTVWFDAMTHALQMPGVGDFRYYGQWDLWGDVRGIFTTRAQRRDHVSRVFEIQEALGAVPLAPTVLAHSASGNELVAAVALLEEAQDLNPACWGSLVGTPTFWSGGADLDAFVGTVAQIGAAGWFVSVARSEESLPPKSTVAEVEGMCRTIRSLSEFAPVHIAHGDLAGLPGVAAGATSLGTGWDARQRMLNYGSFAERTQTNGGGGWFQRPTFEGLLAFVPRGVAEVMFAQDETFARSVFTGSLHPGGPREAFDHHLKALGNLYDRIVVVDDYESRFRALRDIYSAAAGDWPRAAASGEASDESDIWIQPYLRGLQGYGSSEGWV